MRQNKKEKRQISLEAEGGGNVVGDADPSHREKNGFGLDRCRNDSSRSEIWKKRDSEYFKGIQRKSSSRFFSLRDDLEFSIFFSLSLVSSGFLGNGGFRVGGQQRKERLLGIAAASAAGKGRFLAFISPSAWQKAKKIQFSKEN